MNARRQKKQKADVMASTPRAFGDGIANFKMRVGMTQANTSGASYYQYEPITMNRPELEFAYQSSWMCELAVGVLAEDMTREGIEVNHDDAELVERIQETFDEYNVMGSLAEAIKWARLYGGAIAVIMVDGQDVSTPLTHIPKGTFRGLCVFDRWQLDINLTDLVQELGENFGKPEYYKVIASYGEVDFGDRRIHHSRVIRFEGRKMPYNIRQIYQGWGGSVLEPVMNLVKGFDLASQSAVQLISKSYLRFYKVRGLRNILANDLGAEGFLKQVDVMRFLQGIEGLTVADKDDEFQTFSYTFTGIPEIILQLGQQVSGALGVPLVRLFGQSPAGLNSTGESDLRNYYDTVKKMQSTTLRSGLKRVLNVVYESLTGQEPDEDLRFSFRPLWQMSALDKATVATANVTSIRELYNDGVIDLPTALSELKNIAPNIGLFGSITDEDIAEAERLEKADLMTRDLDNGEAGYEGTTQSPTAVQRTELDEAHPAVVPKPAV